MTSERILEDQAFEASARALRQRKMAVEIKDVITPRGKTARLYARLGTSDLSVIASTYKIEGSPFVDDYELRTLPFADSGHFVDVGALVGDVGIAVLIDHPGWTATFVEPVPENVTMIRYNLALNDLDERATVIAGAVGTDHIEYGEGDRSAYALDNRYMAGVHRVSGTALDVTRVYLADLLPADALQVDCEGGEADLFADPRISEVPLIFGEWHDYLGPTIKEKLGETHDLRLQPYREGVTGFFWAVAK